MESRKVIIGEVLGVSKPYELVFRSRVGFGRLQVVGARTQTAIYLLPYYRSRTRRMSVELKGKVQPIET